MPIDASTGYLTAILLHSGMQTQFSMLPFVFPFLDILLTT